METLNEGVKKLLKAHEYLQKAGERFDEAKEIYPSDNEDDFIELRNDCYALAIEIDKLCQKVFEAKARI